MKLPQGLRVHALVLALHALALVPAVTPASASQPTAAKSAPAKLEDSAWVVTLLNGRAPLSGTTLTLGFEGCRVAGSAGCNRFTAPVQVEGLRRRIGTPVTGRRLCPGSGVMEQEKQFLAALSTAASLRLEGETLELRHDDGAIALTLRSAP